MGDSSQAPPREAAPRQRLDGVLDEMSVDRAELPAGMYERLLERARHPHRRLSVGRYLVLREIGRGGMGVVYEAWDPGIERRVAIKTMEPDLVPEEEREEVTQRFRRETKIVGRLHHPAIVTIYDFGQERGRNIRGEDGTILYYYVMEYLEGEPLALAMRARGIIPDAKAVEIARTIAEALELSHGAGVIHRDIKPSNIFLRRDGSAVLLDFGIAKTDSVALTRQGQILGTPSYLAPERLREKEVAIDGRADVFSLGALLFTMLTGSPPFVGSDVYDVIDKIAQESHPKLRRETRAGQALSKVIDRMLAKDPDDRYATAGEASTALGHVLELLGSGDRADTADLNQTLDEERGLPAIADDSNTTLDHQAASSGDLIEPGYRDQMLGDGPSDDTLADPSLGIGVEVRTEGEPRGPNDRTEEATQAGRDAPPAAEPRRGSRPRRAWIEASLVDEEEVVVRPAPLEVLKPDELPTQTGYRVKPKTPVPVASSPATDAPRARGGDGVQDPAEALFERARSASDPSRSAAVARKTFGAEAGSSPLSSPGIEVRISAIGAPGDERARMLRWRLFMLATAALASIAIGLLARRLQTPDPPVPAVGASPPVAAPRAVRRGGDGEPDLVRPRSVEELLADAEAAEGAGELGEAERLFESAYRAAPEESSLRARALLGQADVLRRAGHDGKAEALYRVLLGAYPKSDHAEAARVALEEMGRSRSALPERQRAEGEEERALSPEAECRAILERHIQKPEIAIRSLLLMRARHPRAPCVYWNLGRKYEALGDRARAAEAYRRFLEVDPLTPKRAAVERKLGELR